MDQPRAQSSPARLSGGSRQQSLWGAEAEIDSNVWDAAPGIDEFFESMERQVEAAFVAEAPELEPLPPPPHAAVDQDVRWHAAKAPSRSKALSLDSKAASLDSLPAVLPTRRTPSTASLQHTAVSDSLPAVVPPRQLVSRALSSGCHGETGRDQSPMRLSSMRKVASLACMLDSSLPPVEPSASERRQARSTSANRAHVANSLRSELAANLSRVLDVFRRLDEDNSGEVDRKEFARVSATLELKNLRPSPCMRLEPRADATGSSRLSGPLRSARSNPVSGRAYARR